MTYDEARALATDPQIAELMEKAKVWADHERFYVRLPKDDGRALLSALTRCREAIGVCVERAEKDETMLLAAKNQITEMARGIAENFDTKVYNKAVAELTRLRARVERLEAVREAAARLSPVYVDWLSQQENLDKLRAALDAARL